jgi:hypothetical protein
MVGSIKLSPKYALVSTCLLLVLVAGIMAQTAAQSTNMSLDLTVYGLTGSPIWGLASTVYFQAVVNGKAYCIFGPLAGFPIVQVNRGYEGECDNPGSTLAVAGTITIDLQGQNPPYALTVVVDLTAGGIKIESKFTGNLNINTGCTFSNLVSQYTSVSGAGLNLNLQLLSYTGTCSVPGVITLDLTFGTAAAAVGGVVIPVNKFAVLAPWLALIGLVGSIGTVFVVAKKRRQ